MPLPIIGAAAIGVATLALRKVVFALVKKVIKKFATKILPKILRWSKKLVKISSAWTKRRVALIKSIGAKVYSRLLNLITSIKASIRKVVAAFKRLKANADALVKLLKGKIADIAVVKKIIALLNEFKKNHKALYATLTVLVLWVRRFVNLAKWLNRLENTVDALKEIFGNIKEWWESQKEADALEKDCNKIEKDIKVFEQKILIAAKPVFALA